MRSKSLIATIHLRELTKPAVFVQPTAKQHDDFVPAITFGVIVNTRASFWLETRRALQRQHRPQRFPEIVPALWLLVFKRYVNHFLPFLYRNPAFAIKGYFLAVRLEFPYQGRIQSTVHTCHQSPQGTDYFWAHWRLHDSWSDRKTGKVQISYQVNLNNTYRS